MSPNTFVSRVRSPRLLEVLAVMLTAVLIAKRLRWSSFSKRLVSAE